MTDHSRLSRSGPITLANARVPRSLLPRLEGPVDADGLALVDLRVAEGRVESVTIAGRAPAAGVYDLEGRQVWPCFLDVHTHLDKGHTLPRAVNADGTVLRAVKAVARDRTTHWSAEDVRRRFEFGLRCSYAHGTKAIRTHLDCDPPQEAISWPVFEALRKEWAGRIDLQAVGKYPLGLFLGAEAEAIGETVARFGGVLGAVTRMPGLGRSEENAAIDRALDRLFDVAAAFSLEVDLHVDETSDPESATLGQVARTVLRKGFDRRVVCGHCCSLAMQAPAAVDETLRRCREAGIAVVTLPMVNQYLQDRQGERTPRWRGITLVQEVRASGVLIASSSDNCRDPFFAYGDHDLFEVFSQTSKMAHLDFPHERWPELVTSAPAEIMGMQTSGRILPGGPADLVIFKARTASELLARPQADRIVLRHGRPIDTTLPEYRELDELLG